MMHMKIRLLAGLIVAAWGLTVVPAMAQGDTVTLQVLMIQAQNDSAPIDRRLEKVEYKLRRVFGFQFYRFIGESSITLPPRGEGVVELPDGHRLRVRISGKGKNAEVRWFRNDEAQFSASVGIAKNSPVVLGGIPSNGGKLIMVLTEQ